MSTWGPPRAHSATLRVLALATCSVCSAGPAGACVQRSDPRAFSVASSPAPCPRRSICGIPVASAQSLPLRRTVGFARNRALRGGGQSAEQTQMAVEGYRTPAQAMVDLVDAKPSPSMSVQPSAAGAKWVLLMQQSAMLELADLAQEELKLAGTRLLAHYDVPSRQMGYQTVTLLHRETRQEYEVEGLPAGRIFNVRWSPTGRRVGLTVLTSEGLFLYTFTPEERKASRAFDGRLSSAFASSFCWIAGGEGVLVNSVPRDRGALPQRPAVPGAPLVQECAAGTKAPARTYQDLLVDAHDEALFRHFCTTQVVLVDLTGATPPRSIGKPAMVVYFKAAPGKELALVEALQEPLSRVVLWSRFAKDVTVFSLSSGEEHKRMAALPLADSMPIGRDACRTGPRRHAWRPDEPGTLWWVEALDNGDPKAVVAHRDALFIQNLVDGSDPVELARTQYRFSDVWWGGGSLDPWGGWPGAAEEGPGRQDVALVRENDWKTRQSRVWQILPGCSASDASRRCPRPLLQYRSEDRYKHPGSPMSVITAADSTVMRRDPSGRVFFAGTGGSEDGDRPFLDLRPLFPRHLAQVPDYAAQSAEAATEADESEGAAAAAGGERQGEVVRLWRCAVGVYESIQNVVQVEPGRQEQGPEADTVSLLTTRETQTETPQLVERSLRISDAVAGAGADTDSPDPAGEAITAFPHPQPALLGAPARPTNPLSAQPCPRNLAPHPTPMPDWDAALRRRKEGAHQVQPHARRAGAVGHVVHARGLRSDARWPAAHAPLGVSARVQDGSQCCAGTTTLPCAPPPHTPAPSTLALPDTRQVTGSPYTHKHTHTHTITGHGVPLQIHSGAAHLAAAVADERLRGVGQSEHAHRGRKWGGGKRQICGATCGQRRGCCERAGAAGCLGYVYVYTQHIHSIYTAYILTADVCDA